MRAVGKENAWFSFNGRKNIDEDLDVQMLSMPTRPHPARKGKLVSVPGVDGKLWQDEDAYDRIVVSLRCVARDNANIDEVNAWLSGEGDLIFGDEDNRAYHARITKEFSRSNKHPRLRGQEFTISFDCEPYRYKVYDDDDTEGSITIEATEYPEPTISAIYNPGTVTSLPFIEIKGNGEGQLMIGQNSLLFYDMSEDDPIYVDCAAKIAYTKTGEMNNTLVLATQHITGEWVSIDPGYNPVTLTDGIRSVTIVPNWRWL